MTSDILDPSVLLSKLPAHLTKKELNSPQDGLAALVHTALVLLGFRLVAVDESSAANLNLQDILPEEWNKGGPAHYLFRYKHDQSSLEYVITVSKLGGRTLINGIANESERTASLDISTNDFSSPSFYPHDLSAASASPLVHGFISSHRVSDLMSQFKLKIVTKLIPGLRKEGYSEQPEEVSPRSRSPLRPTPGPAPVRPEPEHPPFASDVHPGRLPLRNPLEIGRRDLDPIPLHPFQPPPLFPLHGGDDGGMFPGPEHPIFGGRRGPRADFDPRHGPWGGDGYLPPMGAPPGARFDPIGPGIGPRGPFGGGGGGGGGRQLQGPDNDEFMPPGMGDMFS